ncbi:MAG TPA: phenylalanine--tRNA ligase subunit beta [Gemmatimonadales bacterium]|nr:phenylalanine--tRNA ligase subunit beta [Gemmatimonadales bacterium]
MNVSRNWLEGFLRRPLDTDDVVRRLAMLGAPVDAVEPLHAGLEGIIVGLVEEVRQHPNADRLRVCTVNDGTDVRRNVVCGAPNVAAGHRYPFAPVGASVPVGKGGAPMTIERAKLRGETSEGMLCSARELGLGQDHTGLWELDTDAAPGTPLLAAYPLRDDRLVVDVTPNRPDLLGHKGVARELAASYGVPFRLPQLPGSLAPDVPPARRHQHEGAAGGVRVAIEDAEGCPRFHAAVIRGITVGPSPEWLRRRLEAVGVRSINNVVDATNYVMFELNQPMHAYDVATLAGPAVVARRARAGETLTTLDGVARTLTDDMTVIADAERVIGVAGVMGGANTEVSDATRDVFLECAWFEPARIRRTRRALGLSTDASYRFERGVDLWNGMEALRRCIELVLLTAGGELAEAPVDCWPQTTHPPRIFLRLPRVAQVLGVELPQHTVEKYLVAVGCTVVAKPEDQRIAVDVPGWRPDLAREIDLIEEIARQHGYDEFPSDLRRFRVGTLPDAPVEVASARVRRGLVAQGLFEAVTLPMGPADADESVPLLNPLSAEDAALRRRLLPGLLRQVELNWRNQVRDVRLFEIGTVFSRAIATERPAEERRVAGVVTGAREPAHWTGPGPDVDPWDCKGLFEAAVALANPGASVQVEGTAWVARTADGRIVGHAGPQAADGPPWAAAVYGFEVVVDPAARAAAPLRPLPVTPASGRDLALVLPLGLRVAEVEAVIRRAGGALLEGVTVADEYRGAGLPDGTRSVLFHLTFRDPGRTLETAEVDKAEARVLAALQRDLGLQRRGE